MFIHHTYVQWGYTDARHFCQEKRVPFLTPESGQVPMSENQRFQPRVCIQHVRACSPCTGKLEVCPVQIGRVPTWFVVSSEHLQNAPKAYTYKMRSEAPFGRRPEIQCYSFVTGLPIFGSLKRSQQLGPQMGPKAKLCIGGKVFGPIFWRCF